MGRRIRTLSAVAAAAAVMLAACGDNGGSTAASDTSPEGSAAPVVGANKPKVNLSLVGFAVPQSANNAAQAAFAKTADGKNTTWTESYGASGDQSRAVVSGLKADYVHFSLDADVTRLVTAGLVRLGSPARGLWSIAALPVPPLSV